MAAREGMAIANAGQRVTEQMADGVYVAPPDADNSRVQGGAKAVAFQRKLTARDPMDDEMNLRQQLNLDGTGMTQFGQMTYDDRIGRWLQRKQAVAEDANFQSWFGREFNKDDLASRQWAQQLNPEFYNQVDREMMERAQVITKIKGIQNRGPQNYEDLVMLYMLDTGKVQLPEDWDRLGPSVSTPAQYNARQAQNQENFRAGLIRLPKFLTRGQQLNRAAQNAARGAPGSAASVQQTQTFNPWAVNQPNGPLARGPNSVGNSFLNVLGAQ